VNGEFGGAVEALKVAEVFAVEEVCPTSSLGVDVLTNNKNEKCEDGFHIIRIT
jgi:hypothetical protein